MIPTELVLRNFMCYRDDLEPLRFDGLHIACLSGENGAGKSALLDAITWALWGKARMSDDELIAQGEQEMLVDLSFQLSGQTYRVRRQRRRSKSGSRSGGKSSLELQVMSDAGWRPIGNGKISETEQSIENLLHMKYDTFINSAFLLQGRADEFTRKPPGERKQVLADILDLREYAVLESRAKERARQFGDAIKGLDGVIQHLQRQVDQLEAFLQEVQRAERWVEDVTQKLNEAEQARQAATAELQALETRMERRAQVQADLQKLRSVQAQRDQELADLRLRIGEAEALLGRADEIQAGMAMLAEARSELKRLEGLQPRYEELREQRRHYQDLLKDELRALQREQDRLKHGADELEQRVARRPAVQAALQELEPRLEAMDALGQELQTLREALAACDQRIEQANALIVRRSDYAKQIDMRQDSLVGVREEQQRIIESRERDLVDVPRWRADHEQALAQQQALQQLSEQLAALQEQERLTSERVGELRAYCTQFKRQADQIKQDRERLNRDDTLVCPVCRSELGHDGVATILEHYDQEVVELRQRYRDGQQEAQALERDLERIRTEVARLGDAVSQAQAGAARLDMLQRQLAQADQWQAELDQARIKLADVQRQLDTEDYEQAARASVREIDRELAALAPDQTAGAPDTTKRTTKRTKQTQAPVLAALSRQRDELRQRQRELEQQLEARSELTRQRDQHRYELAELEQAAAELPAARQRVAEIEARIERKDFAHDIRVAGRAIDADLEALGYTVEAHTSASTAVSNLEHWASEERQLSEARIRLESDQRLLQQMTNLHDNDAASIEQLTREDARLEHELRTLPAVRQQAATSAATVEQCRKEYEVALNDLGERRRDCDTARAAAEHLAQQQAERARCVERQGVFQELAEAFGKKGVQAMLIETAIPEIERESNRLLNRMTDNQMHLTFEMQRDTKKGDTVETLEIRIADALGTRAYDAFSGGEAMRVNFAIRVALARLLARRAGASLETLVIDEGFGALDSQGRERFVEAITGIQQDFKRILVITHLEELKERFPVQIEITKTSSGSRWAII